ncbi:TetR/AcrR family transcriptional regulator [Brachybacterium sp. FME24]|uniref:TetR/AcrR family transcriptional regulator n=1 Tax=Brachybacterium sp. FME24 TaxID=2742605 RepID=UPI001868BA65|nr:TetR/AcrR family transcriptional regulator [Brachybacterium sp. FME24]
MSERSRSYHHGDLRAALVTEALEIARTEPAALSLREVTRRAGVSPAAAYRHFRDRSALMGALATEIQHRMVSRMRARTADLEPADPAREALLRLRGVGLGYIDFAIEEPGWFELAFFGSAEGAAVEEEAGSSPEQVPPFAELLAALDDCVAAGALPAERRAGAEFSCWSAVHGCAELMVHGPLRGAPPAVVREVAQRVVDDIITGIR